MSVSSTYSHRMKHVFIVYYTSSHSSSLAKGNNHYHSLACYHLISYRVRSCNVMSCMYCDSLPELNQQYLRCAGSLPRTQRDGMKAAAMEVRKVKSLEQFWKMMVHSYIMAYVMHDIRYMIYDLVMAVCMYGYRVWIRLFSKTKKSRVT